MQEAYQNGWVSSAFDLGGDYTQAVTRGQFARLAVDFVAAEQAKTVEQLIEECGILLVEPITQEEATPEEQVGVDVSIAPGNGASSGDPLDGGLAYVMGRSFSDTSSVYVELAARMGIVQGVDGMFRPAARISRAEAATMLQRCLGVLGIAEANVQPQQFQDAYQIRVGRSRALSSCPGAPMLPGRRLWVAQTAHLYRMQALALSRRS